MEPEELGRLIDRHASGLELYARQWCDVAEDVVQEALVKLATQRPAPENPAAWLFRVVRHGAINAATAARRRKRHETAAGEAWFQSEPAEAALAIDAESAEEALRALPIEEREVIVAHLWGGLTFEQVADVAGCSSSTAHRLYQTGLTTLRERLGVPCHRHQSPRSRRDRN